MAEDTKKARMAAAKKKTGSFNAPTDKKKPVKNEYTMTKNNKVKTISEGKFERVSKRLVKKGGSETGSNTSNTQTAYSKSGNKSVNRKDVNNSRAITPIKRVPTVSNKNSASEAAAKRASTNLKSSNPFQKY